MNVNGISLTRSVCIPGISRNFHLSLFVGHGGHHRNRGRGIGGSADSTGLNSMYIPLTGAGGQDVPLLQIGMPFSPSGSLSRGSGGSLFLHTILCLCERLYWGESLYTMLAPAALWEDFRFLPPSRAGTQILGAFSPFLLQCPTHTFQNHTPV